MPPAPTPPNSTPKPLALVRTLTEPTTGFQWADVKPGSGSPLKKGSPAAIDYVMSTTGARYGSKIDSTQDRQAPYVRAHLHCHMPRLGLGARTHAHTPRLHTQLQMDTGGWFHNRRVGACDSRRRRGAPTFAWWSQAMHHPLEVGL